MDRPNCYACAHFRLTWDPRLPYGCRAFGMRSARLPSAVVRANSGQECQAFSPKPPRDDDTAGR